MAIQTCSQRPPRVSVYDRTNPCRYATPFGLTSEYAHPAEILFLGFATVVGPALTGPHLFTLWLWMVLRVLETVEAHSGYHFPWSPSNFLPLYGGSDFHDHHHCVLYTKSGNYASTFVYMDWLFGTDKDYRKAKTIEEKKEESVDCGSCLVKTSARLAIELRSRKRRWMHPRNSQSVIALTIDTIG
ncbi:unnamed protein product [Miscanthus lutarioriparius]|uniref:aldehyde oxygenase (deformylating) n=1 Tax=Miscanthus lutarioriparius TaxID=422564 RepID=A0A811MP29_9POAL|nr:unnamed protein product [Miscanthus lutarioriparius]